MKSQVTTFICLIALGGLLTGCSGTVTIGSISAQFSKHKQETVQLQAGELSPASQLIADSLCPAGMPMLDDNWDFGPTDLVVRDGYVLEHSAIDKIPLWVCEYVQSSQLTGSEKRKNRFKPDPQLEEGRRSELDDYKYSGYDRGHQAPAGDQTTDATLKVETFYLSNMAPQVGQFNQRIWKALETLVRGWAENRGAVWIITGGLLYDPEEDDLATADGIIFYTQIGEGQVTVPTHFYKIVAAQDASGAWDAIGFTLENRQYDSPYDFSSHVVSIDWIEERAGIDFLPDLDPMTAGNIEGTAASLWP